MHSKIAFMVAIALTGCATDEDSAMPHNPSGGGKADDATGGFLGSLPGYARYIALDQLDEIIPTYLTETRSVIATIDALPAAIADTTALDEVPIPDLFAPGNVTLLEVLDDADFAGGRTDHDVAWLRQSATDLDALRTAVTQLIGDGTSPAAFDEHLTNTSFWQGNNGALEITLGVAAVSRFYCNLDIRIANDPTDGFTVGASESCD